jgi:hypothetical protein
LTAFLPSLANPIIHFLNAMRKVLLVLFIFVSLFASAQSGTSSFSREGFSYPESKDTLGMVSITTENTTDRFFAELDKRWGAPRNLEATRIYTLTNNQWSKEKILVKIETAFQVDLQDKKENVLFITIQTKSGFDLLSGKSKRSAKIKDDLEALYQRTILTAPTEKF